MIARVPENRLGKMPPLQRIASKIRPVPDFPKPGIVFRDITPLMRDPDILRLAVMSLLEPFRDTPVDIVIGMEARGFVFGALAAWELGAGFVPLRKPGKLPCDVEGVDYDLEYGAARLEVHRDGLEAGDRVLVVDDLIATGGTAAASCNLVERLGARVAGCAFVIEIEGLGGRDRLAGYPVHSLLHY